MSDIKKMTNLKYQGSDKDLLTTQKPTKTKGVEMKRDKIKEIQHLAIALVAACFIFCSISTAKAETFCVQTSSALQSALNTAANNGEADEIQIVQGTYTGNFTYETQEGYKLTVKGGYVAGCCLQGRECFKHDFRREFCRNGLDGGF